MIRTHVIESDCPWTELRLGVPFRGMTADRVAAIRDRADAAMAAAGAPERTSTVLLDLGACVSHRIWERGSVISASLVCSRTVPDVAVLLVPIHIEVLQMYREQLGHDSAAPVPPSHVVVGGERDVVRRCADRIESGILGCGGEHGAR